MGSAPLDGVPRLPELPAQIWLKYLTAVNRWTTLAAGRAATLQQATGGDLSRSLMWRELLHRYGICDVMSVAFTDRFGWWGFLACFWPASAPAFDHRGTAFLGQLAAIHRGAAAHPGGRVPARRAGTVGAARSRRAAAVA